MAVFPDKPRATKAGKSATTPSEVPERSRAVSEGPLTPREFTDLFSASAETLWTIAAAVGGDPIEAEDVLQEAALAALAKLDQFQRGTSFVGWMGSFVRNHARNFARKRQRRATRPLEPEALEGVAGVLDRRNGRRVRPPEEELHGRPVLTPGGDLPIDLEAFDDALLGALGQLGEEQRAALLLRVVNGLSYPEVGSALGIPPGTAASHVHRARARLRELLGVEPEGEGALRTRNSS